MKRLRDLGNTVIVVEHDEEAIRTADWVVDMGPGAGVHGGHVVAEGTPEAIMANPDSITGQYLTGKREIPVPPIRRIGHPGQILRILDARGNNLKGITAEIPLGTFCCVTGVSGGGKSTLIVETLYKALAKRLNNAREQPAPLGGLEGVEFLDKIVDIDQSPIGRTPRSNPATYTGCFTPIRDWFTGLPEAKSRGYLPGRFSFNVKGGRCEACQGDGVIKIEMHFLPDVYVQCDVCKGRRYNRETLEVLFRTQEHCRRARHDGRRGRRFLPRRAGDPRQTADLAAGRARLHPYRPAGDDALGRRGAARQAGQGIVAARHRPHPLHPRRADDRAAFRRCRKLLDVLHALVETGNTVLVIEHNLEVIKTADWIIDLGPEGGDAGGHIVATGTPEDIASCEASYTGQYLRPYLARRPAQRRRAG